MPRIILKCSSCNKDLNVDYSNVDSLGDIVVAVESCPNLDCHDCTECKEYKESVRVKALIKEMAEAIEK